MPERDPVPVDPKFEPLVVPLGVTVLPEGSVVLELGPGVLLEPCPVVNPDPIAPPGGVVLPEDPPETPAVPPPEAPAPAPPPAPPPPAPCASAIEVESANAAATAIVAIFMCRFPCCRYVGKLAGMLDVPACVREKF